VLSLKEERIHFIKYLYKKEMLRLMTELFKVPKDDWVGVSLLPTEQFVDKNGKPVPKYRVWDSP